VNRGFVPPGRFGYDAGMAEFIVNPRRAPRAPARCHAVVLCGGARFDAETEDIGSMGCQVVSPRLLRRGEPVDVLVTNEKVEEPLEARGRVAWVSAQAPWRIGVAFEEASVPRSARWFERLVAAYPGLSGYRRVPERIRTDTAVYLGPPPRFLVDFSADEAVLLRAIASGARIDELMARLRDGWSAAQRALFSLIARQAVTFQRGQAVHPDSWRKILTEVEASLALESLDRVDQGLRAPSTPPAPRPAAAPAAPVPAAPPAAPRAPAPRGQARSPAARAAGGWTGAQPYDPTRLVELQDDGSSLELAAPTPAPGAPDARRDAAHGRDPAAAGWRRSGRSAEAQAAYDGALAEIQAGNVSRALALLRQALLLAPGDSEIAQRLGTVAFKDRRPGGR
jgi:hypothetical protein